MPGGQYLGDHNVAVGRSAPFDEAVQDKLRDLGGFPTACGSSDEHHGVAVDGGQDLLLKLFDGQLLTFLQHLQHRQVRWHPMEWDQQHGQRVLLRDLLQVAILVQLAQQLLMQLLAELLRGALQTIIS